MKATRHLWYALRLSKNYLLADGLACRDSVKQMNETDPLPHWSVMVDAKATAQLTAVVSYTLHGSPPHCRPVPPICREMRKNLAGPI